MERTMQVIARMRSDFPTKFGIPRQSGLVEELVSEVVFEPAYRNDDALRGITGFSHLWLIWEFSEAVRDTWSPTVRPPRLGGNTRLGVFATRSPFRPNPIGLSCVRLLGLRPRAGEGTALLVAGADLMDGTPIYDIKPYLPYADAHPEAVGGFTETADDRLLTVDFPAPLRERIPPRLREALVGVLAHDPRPSYQSDPSRVYGMRFGDFDVRFTVADDVLTVCEVVRVSHASTAREDGR